MPLSMTRVQLSALCEEELTKVKDIVRACLEDSGIEAGKLTGAQVLGGGCRMPTVQAVIGAEVRGEVFVPRGDWVARLREACFWCPCCVYDNEVYEIAGYSWCSASCLFLWLRF